MNLRAFVSGSAIVLMGWLVVSFFHRNLPERYSQTRTADAVPAPEGPSQSPSDSSLASAVSPSP